MKESNLNNLKKEFSVFENNTSRNFDKLDLGIERYLRLSEQITMWKRYFIFSLIMIFSLLILSVFLFINRSQVNSYLIKVNENGELVGSEKLQTEITTIGSKEIEYFMKKWIKDTRVITLDRKVFDSTVREANYFLTPEAQAKLKNILSLENVNLFFEQGRTRDVEILTFTKIPESENTYQIRWKENEYSNTGQILNRKKYSAIVKIKNFKPTLEQMQSNPFGIIIVDYNMQVENN